MLVLVSSSKLDKILVTASAFLNSTDILKTTFFLKYVSYLFHKLKYALQLLLNTHKDNISSIAFMNIGIKMDYVLIV